MAQAKEFQVKVVGAAAVLRTASGSDTYLYSGAVVESREFDERSLKHGLAIGLLEKVAAPAQTAAQAKAAAEAKAKADAAAQAKAEADAKAAAEAEAKAKATADAAAAAK